MNTMIDNFINGNLTDAKRQARRFSVLAIMRALSGDYGYTNAKAMATAAFLKGQGTFQAACDAK